MKVQALLQGKQSQGVVTIGARETLSDLVARLRKFEIGAVVVVDSQHAMVGVISERDVIRAISELGENALSAGVTSYMTKAVQSAAPDDPAERVLEKMTEGRFRHMPVIDNGALVGVISIGDVVKARIDSLRAENAAMEAFIQS